MLTTQLYFPEEARNQTDRIFAQTLLLDIVPTSDGRFGLFDFVIS